MIRIVKIKDGVKSYADCDPSEDSENLNCPYCKEAHKLNRHGWFERNLVFNGYLIKRIPIRRLLCKVIGRTVSLLPDFCLPHRQYGIEALSIFLTNYYLEDKSLLSSLRAVNFMVTSHSLGQHWVYSLKQRMLKVQDYLARQQHRFPDACNKRRNHTSPINRFFSILMEGYPSLTKALLVHGPAFYRLYGISII